MMGRLLAFMGRCLLRLRYRVDIEGEAVPSGVDGEGGDPRGGPGCLILPNHPALVVDPAILVAWLFPRFAPRTLADRDQIAPWGLRHLARALRVMPIPDPVKYGEACRSEVDAVLTRCVEGLKAGENWMIYPAGRVYRSRFEDLGGASAVERILREVPETRVVLVRSRGLWGSRFSFARGGRPDLSKLPLQLLRWALLNLLILGPRRRVSLHLEEVRGLPVMEGRQALNRALEALYNQDAPAAWEVPLTHFEGKARQVPEPEALRREGNLETVNSEVREAVGAQLRELSGVQTFADEAELARDLGLDSLARMELLVWIQREFGNDVSDPEGLQRVSDVLLAAAGQGSQALAPLQVPISWGRGTLRPQMPAGATIPEVFLAQALRDPLRVISAEGLGGQARTFRDLLTGILALRPAFRKLEGRHVGVLLPASGGAALAYLALLFAGKVPVMLNWTAGPRNLGHALDLLDVRHVVTASALVAKLEAQGTDLGPVKARLVPLDALAAGLSLPRKLWAACQARLMPGRTKVQTLPSDTAVVLFTSGSESLPKAVPLTHANLLANLRDIAQMLELGEGHSMIGFLPPFHSFGLTGTTLLPLLGGLPVVYHPNPTDGANLARIVEAYGVSILVGTPTFLGGLLRASRAGQLQSLRLAVSGAEKCPEALFETLAERYPSLVVLEGYGITECSPVVSANRPGDVRRGTIGRPLASVEWAVVDVETGVRVEPGRSGLLLVRGPSIFGGYLHAEGASPFETFEGKSWYRTGDLVRVDGTGCLVFAGRLKRFVKLGGEMVSLPAVEEALQARFPAQDGVPVLAVEALEAQGTAELTLFTTLDLEREVANGVLREAGLSPLHFIRRVRRLEAIPLLGTGKTDYRSLKGLGS